MKKRLKMVVNATMLVALLIMAACVGDDPSQPETERIMELLTNGNWQMQNVRVDNTDRTLLYKNLSLAFAEGNYTTTNGGTIWPASGTWSFTDETAKTILRSDGVIISLGEVTSTSLVLSFDWASSTIGAGREQSVKGAHVFTFSK